MSPERIAELRALAEKATPGPWRHGPLFWEVWAEAEGARVFEVPHTYPDGAHQPGVYVDPDIGREREPDAAYIAALDPTTVLALLDAVSNGMRAEGLREAAQAYRDRPTAANGRALDASLHATEERE